MKTLTAFCDLQFCPVSFDFVTWLVRAMKERDDRGCDAMHVILVPHEAGLGHFARNWGKHDEAATRWRLWHIVVASCPLANATVTMAASRYQAIELKEPAEARNLFWWPEGKAHFMGPLVEAGRRGEAVPKLQATVGARRYVNDWLRNFAKDRTVVTLTTRDQSTDPDRNSNIEAWNGLNHWLHAQGFCSIVLEDSNLALGQGRGYAELDPDLRLALYERARLNLIGNNGPQELLKFSAAPYLAFNQAQSAGWQDHFRKYFSMEPGDQLPWAGKYQKLVYRPDDFEILKEEFQQFAWDMQAA